MKNFETSAPRGETLKRLKETEEAYRQTLAEATKPIAEGGATPAVIEDLQIRYFLAKQEREDFEKIG